MKKVRENKRIRQKGGYRVLSQTDGGYVVVGPESKAIGVSVRIAKDRAKNMAKYVENVSRFYLRDKNEIQGAVSRVEGKTRDQLKEKYKKILLKP